MYAENVQMLYFNENLISKKEERAIYSNEREEYFKSILSEYAGFPLEPFNS